MLYIYRKVLQSLCFLLLNPLVTQFTLWLFYFLSSSLPIHSFIHSFIPAISIVPLQVLYHSKALPTTARILYRSFMPKRYTKLNSLIYTSWSGPLQKSMVGYYGYGCAYYLYLALERGLSYCTVHEIYLYQKSMA